MTADLFSDGPLFRTTLIDPPWPERGGGKVKRGADRHYDLLDKPGCTTVPNILSVIRQSPLWRPTGDAGHLWCWVTDNYLIAGLWLIAQLGFKFKRTFQWVKTDDDADDVDEEDTDDDLHAGIGQYARGCHEMLLFCVAGSGKSPLVYQDNRSVKSVIYAPRERDAAGKVVHSRKPLRSYERIEQRSKGPYAELFARRDRDGWSSWGSAIDGGR